MFFRIVYSFTRHHVPLDDSPNFAFDLLHMACPTTLESNIQRHWLVLIHIPMGSQYVLVLSSAHWYLKDVWVY